MSSTPFCPFRKPLRRPRGEHTHGCDAGMNFYGVRANLGLCQTCPVPAQLQAYSCEHLEVLTRLSPGADSIWRVEVELYCHHEQVTLFSADSCARCPYRLDETQYFIVTASSTQQSEYTKAIYAPA